MKTQKWFSPLFAILMALVLLAVSISPVFAGTPEPAKPVPGLGKVTDSELRNMWLRVRARYDNQYIIIRDSYKLAALFDSLIADQKAKGRDVYVLEVAVSEFYGVITAAEAARLETAKYFSTNAGFNDYMNIVDRNAAGRSILEARSSLKGTQMQLELAVKTFKQTYHSWWEKIINRRKG